MGKARWGRPDAIGSDALGVRVAQIGKLMRDAAAALPAHAAVIAGNRPA